MIDWLEGIDRSIVVWVNGNHTPFLDKVMWLISARITWIPLYLLLLFLAYKLLDWKKAGIFLLLAVLAIALTDLCSVHLFKNMFLRYRPSHHTSLTNILHFYEIKPDEFYKGGQYGFVSSHAANFFAIATFSILVLRKRFTWLPYFLLFIAFLVCYSRLYLGVHYLSDVVVGGLVGALISYLVWKFAWKRWGEGEATK